MGTRWRRASSGWYKSAHGYFLEVLGRTDLFIKLSIHRTFWNWYGCSAWKLYPQLRRSVCVCLKEMNAMQLLFQIVAASPLYVQVEHSHTVDLCSLACPILCLQPVAP
jgi:hypothetical protein